MAARKKRVRNRTGGDRGNSEIDLILEGFGRFRMTAGTKKAKLKKARESLARRLDELGQLEVLRALKDGELSWPVVMQAQRQKRLESDSLAADLRLKLTLRKAILATLPQMGKAAVTQERYAVGLDALAALGFDLETDPVSKLLAGKDDPSWAERLDAWTIVTGEGETRKERAPSPATKNAVRGAVSRFLTRYLGDKNHPFRRAVLHEDSWKRLPVPKRVKGVAEVGFWQLMAEVPERAIPSYIVLASSGMRVGEYLHADISIDETHHTINTFGKTGPKTYGVDPHAWAYVKQAVPCRVSMMRNRVRKDPVTRLQNDPRYNRLYRWLKTAGEKLGIAVTVHDLRRLYARLGTEEVGQVATQHAIGHETPGMTADYARWHTQQQVSTAVAKRLGLVPNVSGEMSGDMVANGGDSRGSARPQRQPESPSKRLTETGEE